MLRGSVAFCSIVIAISCADPYSFGPSARDLKEQFAVELPAHMHLKSFEVEAAANVGSKVEPKFRARFHSQVILKSNTYIETKRIGDDVHVSRKMNAGDVKDLYGAAESIMSAGSWRTTFTLEGNQLQAIGAPGSQFTARRVCWDDPLEYMPPGGNEDTCIELKPESFDEHAGLNLLKGRWSYVKFGSVALLGIAALASAFILGRRTTLKAKGVSHSKGEAPNPGVRADC